MRDYIQWAKSQFTRHYRRFVHLGCACVLVLCAGCISFDRKLASAVDHYMDTTGDRAAECLMAKSDQLTKDEIKLQHDQMRETIKAVLGE